MAKISRLAVFAACALVICLIAGLFLRGADRGKARIRPPEEDRAAPARETRELGDAKIAIVLDDFGYSMNNIKTLFGISAPLTLSVLPNLPYSARIAKEADARGFEIILHLPLEPLEETLPLERGTLMVEMSGEESAGLLAEAIECVPGIKGVSNHMGSRATGDRDFMRGVFEELKKRELYFLDNLVTDESVCGDAASETGICLGRRDVFLDNSPDEEYIKRQVLEAADVADKTGRAIAVGHDRASTIKVLAEAIPELEKEGFEFVYLSELVR